MEEFKTYTLEELSIGKGRYGIAASAVPYDPKKFTYLRITDINDDGTLDKAGMMSVDDPNASDYLLKANDLVFARTGNSTGRTYFYEGTEPPLVYAGFLIKFSVDDTKVNPRILKYYTHTQTYYDWVKSFDTGGTRGNINAKTYGSMPVCIPKSREVQNQIVELLSSLDDKIELNRRINENLEQQAQALFKAWFVDFDFANEEGKPYKSSGGKMVWNDRLKREIPYGWMDKSIKDFMRIFTGKKDVSKAIPGEYKFFSCAPEPITSNEYLYDGYAVLVSGNGSYTGRVGFYKGKFDLYQRTYACTLEDNPSSIPFFYYTLKCLFEPAFTGGTRGSSIPYIVLGDLADFSFAFNNLIKDKFINVVKPMFDEQLCRKNEIEQLNKLRDMLLPRLMSGKLMIK